MGTVTELPDDTDWGWETSQTAGYILLGMLNDTENDRQCSRHREIEYGCHSRTVYLPIIIGIILQDESYLNEMEI